MRTIIAALRALTLLGAPAINSVDESGWERGDAGTASASDDGLPRRDGEGPYGCTKGRYKDRS